MQCIKYVLWLWLKNGSGNDNTVLSDIISVFGKLNEEDVEDIPDAEVGFTVKYVGCHAILK